MSIQDGDCTACGRPVMCDCQYDGSSRAVEEAKAEARKEAINEAIAVIQEAREEGETDHRTMIYRLQHLLLK